MARKKYRGLLDPKIQYRKSWVGPFREISFSIKPSKVVIDNKKPGKLELWLSMDDPNTNIPPTIAIHLKLPEFGTVTTLSEYTINDRYDQLRAFNNYKKIIQRLRTGNYTIYLYNNGKVGIGTRQRK